MSDEEVRAEREHIPNRNPDVSITREEEDRVDAPGDEPMRRAEAALDAVRSGEEAEPSGDEVGEATTEHPIENTAEDSAEGSAVDLNEEPSADGTAEESGPAKKPRTRRSKDRSTEAIAH
jgi:hypothetical protein